MISKIIIDNLKVENLKPLRKSFQNKNNMFSAKGIVNGKQVKVYEIYDKKQGPLRKFISNHNGLSKYFPKLITYDNQFIVEEWLLGTTLRKVNSDYQNKILPINEIKNLINLMWSTKYNIEAFDYVKYIYSRVNKTCKLDLSNLPLRINHNDLSLDNIIKTKDGIKIIDNEFLGCNTGWILNIKNSFLEENFSYQNFVSSEDMDLLWDIRKEWTSMNLSAPKKIIWQLKKLIKKKL